MTYHSDLTWNFDDAIPENLITEIVSGLESNKTYNQNGKYTPYAYVIFSAIDT